MNLNRIYVLIMAAIMFLVPYAISGLGLPPPSGGVGCVLPMTLSSLLRLHPLLEHGRNNTSWFLSPSPRSRTASAWPSHSSHCDASVLEGPHGDRGAGEAPAIRGIQAPVMWVSQCSDDSCLSHCLCTVTWETQVKTTLLNPPNAQQSVG